MNSSNSLNDVAAPTTICSFFSSIKLSSLIELRELILSISFLSFVTIKERSVPPLKNIEFG